MNSTIALLRFANLVALAVPAGAMLLCILGRPSKGRGLALLELAAAMLVFLQIAVMASIVDAQGAMFNGDVIAELMTGTWSGKVLALRIGAAVLAALWFALGGARLPAISLGLAAAGLFLAPLSGHAVTAEPLYLSLLLHGTHVSAAGIWVGAVGVLARTAGEKVDGEKFKLLLRRFSPWAMRLVSLAVFSGLVAAWLQVGGVAALIGTHYGQLLILKALVLLPLALWAAAWLRTRYLKSEESKPPLFALLAETLPALGVMLIASFVSQGVPGRHDAIVWPLPFRFDFARLWRPPGPDWSLFALGGMSAVALVAAVYLWRRREKLAGAVVLGAAAIIPGFGLFDVVVPAFPTTFADQPSRYEAAGLMAAAKKFQEQCSFCHGKNGKGDGPLIAQMQLPNADLTARHTMDHTMGDLFWWISNGMPSGLMPGFADKLPEDARWDLVNYVHLLTASERSKELTGEVVPGDPWLSEIDFDFLDDAGNSHSLSDFRGTSSVLLVIGREPGSLDRLQELREAAPQAAAEGLVTIFVCGPELTESCKSDTRSPSLLVLRDNTADIAAAWTFYRRTQGDPDEGNLENAVGHLEFLIDRYGYVRARWRSDEGLFPSVPEIIGQAHVIDNEPQVLPPPGEHGH